MAHIDVVLSKTDAVTPAESPESKEPPSLIVSKATGAPTTAAVVPVPQPDLKLWRDWRWQMKNRLTRLEQIQKHIVLTPQEVEGIRLAGGQLSTAITPYYAALIDPLNPKCPMRRQVIPLRDEFIPSPHNMNDPLAEEEHSPVPGLVHRYPDRVLLLIASECAIHCRYCTRRRVVGGDGATVSPHRLDEAFRYIRRNKKIRDVVISGGDPLSLDDDALEQVIAGLRSIPHIDIIRIGTRMPVTLPFRVTEKLTSMLRRYHPIYMSLHFTHPKDVTPEVREACERLSDAGIPLGSQTVLLKGINDRPSTIKKLMHELLKIRVRPYYLYQCDQVTGTEHFQTPVATGIRIIEELRGYTSGYAVPTYVIDAPGGGGKIPLGPDYVVLRDKGRIRLRNYENQVFEYLEPRSEAQYPQDTFES